MPHFPKPFFKKGRGVWYLEIDRTQINLGPDRVEAFRRYHQLMAQPQARKVAADSVLGVIDAFLEWCSKHRAAHTYRWYRDRLFGVLKERLDENSETPLAPASPQFAALVQLTVELVDHIRVQIRTVDFWRDQVSHQNLETWIYNSLRRRRVDGAKLLDVPDIRELATRIVDLAKHRHRWLVQ